MCLEQCSENVGILLQETMHRAHMSVSLRLGIYRCVIPVSIMGVPGSDSSALRC